MSHLTEREKKRLQEQNERKLLELVRQKGNNTCCDCGATGPRWASFNLGCFLCIKCGGIHRRMGTHISKVKSISLDKWTSEQIQNMEQWGNIKVNNLYLYNAGSRPIPTDDEGMEHYIRDKYERKRFFKPGAHSGITESEPADHFEASLKTLHDMGFTDVERNRRALTRAKTINAAIELMCREADISIPKSTAMDPRLVQLKAMGFEDQARNIAALRQTKGSVEQAIELLVSQANLQRPATSPKASAVLGLSPPTKPVRGEEVFGDFASAFAPQTQPNDDLGGLVFSTNPASTPLPQSTTNGRPTEDKDYIMSLFASNPPQVPHPLGNDAPQLGFGLDRTGFTSPTSKLGADGLNNGFTLNLNPNSVSGSKLPMHSPQASSSGNNVASLDSAFAALDPFKSSSPISQTGTTSKKQPTSHTTSQNQDLLDLL